MIADLAGAGIAYVPYFPLGGFTPLQSDALSEVAGELGATPMQVALAWLLQRSPNMLLILGTSSVAHLTENLKAADIALPEAAVARLDQIGADSLFERWRNNIFASTRSDAYTVRDRPQMTIRQPMGCPVCDPDRMSAPGAHPTSGSQSDPCAFPPRSRNAHKGDSRKCA